VVDRELLCRSSADPYDRYGASPLVAASKADSFGIDHRWTERRGDTHWCLRSIRAVVDEIVIANCGMSEEAVRIASQYQVHVVQGLILVK